MDRRPARSLWVAAVFSATVICLGGCKTSKDATAAATQLSTTSKALSSYYSALDKELQATDQLNMLNEGLNGTPFGPNTQGQIRNTMTAIEERHTIAVTLSQVADAFGKLTGSNASADAASSAGKLEGDVEGLSLLPGELNSTEKNVLTSAVQGVVNLIQQHKERQAAKKMAGVVNELAVLFASEKNVYNSINDQYADLSSSLARELVRDHQVDTSAFAPSLVASALAPYSLTAELSDGLKARLDREVPKEIARESAELKISQENASDGMEESLQEMAKTITILAADKPLATNGMADTLGVVNRWTSTILGK